MIFIALGKKARRMKRKLSVADRFPRARSIQEEFSRSDSAIELNQKIKDLEKQKKDLQKAQDLAASLSDALKIGKLLKRSKFKLYTARAKYLKQLIAFAEKNGAKPFEISDLGEKLGENVKCAEDLKAGLKF